MMKIRNKILIYFSSTLVFLTGLSFIFIFVFFSENREEEFQQRQKQKIKTTLYFLSEIIKTDDELIESLDRLTINDLFDEKLLLFNSKKELIYTSLDDTPISISKEMLERLDNKTQWIETKEGLYDVVGTYIEKNGSTYYGISKAYDTFGYNKLFFLRNILIVVFIAITIAVLLASFYLAKKISKPLTDLAHLLSLYELDNVKLPYSIHTTTYEIAYLNNKFIELVKRTQEAYDFQKHSINYISHELKTPIAVLISELERIRDTVARHEFKAELDHQVIKTKYFADIINVLLEISKAETGQNINFESVRIDEVIFDSIAEVNTLYPNFNFEVNYEPLEPDFSHLTLKSNEMLLKQAVLNLLKNCVAYSDNPRAHININCSSVSELVLSFKNQGKLISKEEEKYVFNHFFRGKNSQKRIGFGLGLVLTKKIINLNSGTISYFSEDKDVNVFELRFALS